MIVFRLYTFGKKQNSTVRPSGDGNRFDGYLLDGSDVDAPRVVFNSDDLQTMDSTPPYNYARMAPGGSTDYHYYFIDRWTYSKNGWIASMHLDALATYRTEIANYTAYVTRSSARSDGSIVDQKYPMRASLSYAHTQDDFLWNPPSSNSGSYVVAVQGAVDGNPSTMAGTVSYLLMPASTFVEFRNKIYGDNLSMYKQGSEQLGIGDSLAKMIFNPAQYITSCMWIPFTAADVSGKTQITSWKIGFWEFSTIDALYLLIPTNARIQKEIFIKRPKHPQASDRGSYLEESPYSRYELFIPTVGLIPLDNSKIRTMEYITVLMVFDVCTGQAIFRVYGADAGATAGQVLVMVTTGNVSVSIPLSADRAGFENNPIGTMVGAIGSVATGNVLGMASSLAASADQLFQPQIFGVSGGAPAFTKLLGTPSLHSYFRRVVDNDLASFGAPLCQMAQIGRLPGYIECGDSDITIPDATFNAISDIRSHMVNGFFME